MASANNIQRLREARGWSRPRLGELMGTSGQQVERLEKGQRRLAQVWIDKAAAALEVDPTAIISTPDGMSAASLEDLASEHGLALIDEIDLALGMGATFLDGSVPEVIGIVPFRLDWLRGLHEGPLDRLKVVRGKGDSMEPTIHDGDVVLVDTAQRRFDDQDRIWAIAYGDLGMIRRLRQTPRGTWILMPDNHVVRPEEVGDGEVSLIGRVIWIGRRI